MTHWLKSALRRIKEPSAQSAPVAVRGGFSRKMSGVSTVEYALILVAVVAIVGGGMAFLRGEFTELFAEVGQSIDTNRDGLGEQIEPGGTN